MPLAYVGLGSNLGDRVATIAAAVERIGAIAGVRLRRASGLYASPAVDSPVGSPAYLNSVVEIDTILAPGELLRELLSIENELGRIRPVGVVNAPRTCDLDLLAWGDVAIRSEELTLPHPRMTERSFVLAPLVELAPDWRHPRDRLTAAELLRELELRQPGMMPHALSGSRLLSSTPGLTNLDRVGGFLNALGCAAITLLCMFGLITGVDQMILFFAWAGIGTAAIVRYMILAERLDRRCKTLLLGEGGHGFAVQMANADALDAEVVASADEGLPDDRGTASRAT